MRGATSAAGLGQIRDDISIHAPHAGRDSSRPERRSAPWYFNPRAPCGARPSVTPSRGRQAHFNPRAPCGARLKCRHLGRESWVNFNPRAPCGARHPHSQNSWPTQQISIHAPHAGRDYKRAEKNQHIQAFQSTRPMRGATQCRFRFLAGDGISIHAPHAGRDRGNGVHVFPRQISIHAPHAGRDGQNSEGL